MHLEDFSLKMYGDPAFAQQLGMPTQCFNYTPSSANKDDHPRDQENTRAVKEECTLGGDAGHCLSVRKCKLTETDPNHDGPEITPPGPYQLVAGHKDADQQDGYPDSPGHSDAHIHDDATEYQIDDMPYPHLCPP